MNATNNEGIPYCEWPDPDKPGIFRNCCDKDGRVDNNLRKIAAKNRIGEIREQLNAWQWPNNQEAEGALP